MLWAARSIWSTWTSTTHSPDTSKKKGSFSVWDKLRKQITVERQLLDHLMETHRTLIERCATSPPSGVELSALAAALHSFTTFS